MDPKAAKRDFFKGAIAHRRKHNGQPANPDGEVCEVEKCCDARCEAGKKSEFESLCTRRTKMRYDRRGTNLFAKNFCMRRRDQQKLSNEQNESMVCSSPSARFFSLCVKHARKMWDSFRLFSGTQNDSWTRLERKTVDLAFYGLTAPSPVGTCYSWQFLAKTRMQSLNLMRRNDESSCVGVEYDQFFLAFERPCTCSGRLFYF